MKRPGIAITITALLLALGTATATIAVAADLAPIQLTPERRQLIGVTFATVERRNVTKEIDATGTVEADEQLQSDVQTRFAGWIRQVFVNETFQSVRRGQPLFTVYSPDLAITEQEYALALQARHRVMGSDVEGVAEGANSLAQTAAERLSLLGVSQSEVSRLGNGGKPSNVLTVYSPATGYVVERNALPNMYVQPDTKLYTITDYSTVWVYAAIFQNDIGAVRMGDPGTFTVDSYPGASFAGQVDNIWPQIDMTTRTARVRVAFDNRDGRLKPGMFGRVTLRIRMGEQTVIPAGGVIRTGIQSLAFIDRGDGYLVPTQVELGPRVGDDLIVLKGLSRGERIVSSANFLIDSESQLQAASGSFVPPPPGVSAAAGQPQGQGLAVNADLTTDPSPPARGKNKVVVTLKEGAGKPLSGAQVSVTFYMAAMPAMGMAAMKAQSNLTDQGNGNYAGSVELQSGGTWQVTIAASKDGQVVGGKQFNVTVSGPMAM